MRIEHRIARAIREIDIALFMATDAMGRAGIQEARSSLYDVLDRLGYDITTDNYRARKRRPAPRRLQNKPRLARSTSYA